ncbi:MAG: twin-arginine translocase TatA/TatE family subunit [Pirellulaceae bacterium]|jgi:sec-independent protein translocase protein TatA|nr:twin-arginine translocase TatA/TatE family subunit [Pirellulaceae bacterium]
MLPGGIGFSEILVILVIAVVLFGSRLPEVAKNLGKSYQQFRKGLSDLQSSLKIDDTDDHRYGPTPTSSKRLAHYKDAADDEAGDNAAPRFMAPPLETADRSETEQG